MKIHSNINKDTILIEKVNAFLIYFVIEKITAITKK